MEENQNAMCLRYDVLQMKQAGKRDLLYISVKDTACYRRCSQILLEISVQFIERVIVYTDQA